MISLMCEIFKRPTSSQIQRIDWWLSEVRRGGKMGERAKRYKLPATKQISHGNVTYTVTRVNNTVVQV